MDKKREELRGFTIDRIKELCDTKHIKVYGKTNDNLIEQLLGIEFPGEVGGETADEEKLSTTRLIEIVMQMQQDQRALLDVQQRMQEEIME